MSEGTLTKFQTSFAAGELTDKVLARVDLSKYNVGAALIKNFCVDFRGGAYTRAGTQYVGRVFHDTLTTRLIPFQFNTLQNYALEFGHQYMRVIMNGGHVLEPTKVISGVSVSNPVVITSVAHGYLTTAWVYITGISGPTALNNKTYKVVVLTPDTFALQDLNGVGVDSSGMPMYVAGGTVARVYTMATPYNHQDLALLKFAQSADVMTITHTLYAPRNLTRTQHYAWTLDIIDFEASIGPPTGLAVATDHAPSAPVTQYFYTVTAVSADTGDESIPASGQGVDSDDFNTVQMANTVTWTAVTGAFLYNVYRMPWVAKHSVPADSVYGYIGSTRGVELIDSNITADFARTPPIATNPFLTDFPGCVCYFQQRKMFGGSREFPTRIWATQPGSFNNMNVSVPVRDDDAISATLVSLQVNAIKWMVPMPGGLVVLTGSGAWQVSGNGQGSPITPSEFSAQPQAYNGAADVQPIVTNYDILYVQARGSVVRDLSYNFFANIYTGQDLTALSSHLIDGHRITEWAWSEEPDRLVWAVRDDGRALALTYMKDQDVYAWSQHETLGFYKSVCNVPEGDLDIIYQIVKRPIGTQYVQMIERQRFKQLGNTGVETSWSVDCGLALEPEFPQGTLYPENASGVGINLFCDVAVFSLLDVGKVIRSAGGIADIVSVAGPNQVVVNIRQDFTDVLTDGRVIPQEPYKWQMSMPVTTVTGLEHLEGCTVACLADGNVQPLQVVQNGAITLQQPSSMVIAGLPMRAQFQTLRIEDAAGSDKTIQGLYKQIAKVTARVRQTRGLKYGHTFDDLVEAKEAWPGQWGDAIREYTGDLDLTFTPKADPEGQICFEVTDPLPVTILGVIPEFNYGST